MEKTLVLVKPDGVQRGLVGIIIGRLENKGFRLAALKLMNVSRKLAEEHYGEHVDKPFFGNLVRFITSSPIVAMAIEGENAVQVVRTTIGLTNPQEAAPGTIRGDFGLTIGMNLIHKAHPMIEAFFKWRTFSSLAAQVPFAQGNGFVLARATQVHGNG